MTPIRGRTTQTVARSSARSGTGPIFGATIFHLPDGLTENLDRTRSATSFVAGR